MYTVYIIQNPEGRYYVGHTSQTIEARLKEHNSGSTRWTRNKGPWEVRYLEQLASKKEAYCRERQIKRYKGGRAFRVLINTERSHSPVECARLESE